ncbi:hypothetical protein CPT_Moonbeam172 [Bacillus phage Moonbeam]|uniref:Uncharacterized protein n=1 Tax=Bacillus phage Moonbeam TaxID=1540091 RepID=A0A0A0RNA1_9CAUD|nr:hypothetical protein CPT_Moonbeam172 [Bacillus phage Moonbeam]AIW03570.1 hypothetical protein CPT_Moonbeam172 [Bacillus phage Moonbeam]
MNLEQITGHQLHDRIEFWRSMRGNYQGNDAKAEKEAEENYQAVCASRVIHWEGDLSLANFEKRLTTGIQVCSSISSIRQGIAGLKEGVRLVEERNNLPTVALYALRSELRSWEVELEKELKKIYVIID